jgi:hypothetical protein
MAKDKTSFVLYSDSKSIIDLMTNEQAGLLLKTLFAYVNDENPIIDNSIALVFEMIKLQLKRDLKKWEQTKEGRSAAGKASAEAKRLAKLNQQNSTNSTNVDFVQQTSTNSTVSVSVNDSVNVNVINKDSKANLEIRTLAFKETLIPYKQKYSIDMLKDFFGYWTEPNKSNTKLKFELQQTWSISRRLETWAKNDKTFAPKQQIKQDRL